MIRLIEILASGVTDDSGEPLSGGSVYFYEAGTTTLKTAYQDFDLETPHSNPATLDDAGRIVAYGEDRIKLVLKNASGATVRTIDNVGTSDSDLSASLAENIAGNGLIESGDGTIAVDVDATSITISSNQLKIPDSGITSAKLLDSSVTTSKINDLAVTTGKIEDLAVTTGKINDLAVTTAKIAAANVTGSKIESSVNLAGKPTANSQKIITQVTDTTNSLCIVRGQVSSSGSGSAGEGFSVVKNATGDYTVTFTTAFKTGDVPIVTISALSSLGRSARLSASPTASSFNVLTILPADNTSQDSAFHFIAIGQKAD